MAILPVVVERQSIFPSLMAKTEEIKRSLPEPQVARQKARELYHMGLDMIKGELRGQTLIDDDKESVLPVLAAIEGIIKTDGYQDFLPLQRTLSKVYCVFVELRWYQPWRRHETMPTLTELRDRFIKTSKDMRDILRQRQFSTIATFEFRCARQGARRLTPSEPLWQKYLVLVLNLTAAASELRDANVNSTWKALRALGAELSKDCPAGWYTWYQDVHQLRWESTTIESTEEFEQKIGSKIDIYREKGGNYSNCLALLFMRMIKTSNDAKIQEQAFKGWNGRQGLVHLIRWESPSTWKDLAEHPVEKISAKFGKADRFWETRQIALHFLKKLATKPKYQKFHEASRDALRVRDSELKSKDKEKYKREKEELRIQIESCEKQGIDIKTRRLEVVARIKQAEDGRADEKVVKKLEEEKKVWVEKAQAIEAQKKTLSEQSEKIDRVEQIFAQKAAEEEKEIKAILEILH